MATTLAKISIKDSSSWNTYLNLIYPVGSVYFANNNTSPATRFGGTWSAISNSRYLRLANSYTTGGQSDNKISIDCMPSHDHATKNCVNIVDDSSKTTIVPNKSGLTPYWYVTNTDTRVSKTGRGKAYYPAYQSFYCWVRTA